MGLFETSWGYSFSVPFFTKTLLASGPNWEIYQRTDPTQIALAFDGNVTKTTVMRNEQHTDLVAWAENTAQQPGEPPAPPPPADAPAKIKFITSPSGANVLIDGVDTGRLTTVTLPLDPGSHAITFKRTNYKDSVFTVSAVPGTTLTRSRTLTRVEAPPEEPPLPPPPTLPEEEPTTQFGHILKEFLGEVPAWYLVYDNFIKWAEDNLAPIDLGAGLTDEERSVFQQYGLKEKLLFFGGPMSLQQAGKTTAGKAISDMTAAEIKAVARNNPDLLR